MNNILIIAFFLFIGFVYIYYGAFTDSFSFGDEPYYYLSAKSLAHGKIDYTEKLYATGNLEGKGQPMVKSLISRSIPTIFYWMGNGNLTVFKLYTPIFAILTVALTFYIGKKFCNFWTGFLAAILVAFTPLFIHFSIISYMETITVFFVLLAIYTSYQAIKIKNRKWILIAAISLAFAFYIKEIAFFIPIIFLLYILAQKFFYKEFDWRELKIFFLITLIAGIIYTPQLIYNYTHFQNPVYPFYPEIFGFGGLDKIGYELRQSAFSLSFTDIVNFVTLTANFGFLFIFGAFGILYLCFRAKARKIHVWLLLSMAVMFIPFSITGIKDIRYLFVEIPIFALAISLFFNELYKSPSQFAKYYKDLVIGLIIIVCTFGIYGLISESRRIDQITRHMPPGTPEAYEWIKFNTPKDAVVFDLFTPNLVFATDRIGIFTHPVHGGELWNFWKLSEYNALEVLEKHKINYVVVETMYFQPPETLKYMAWTAIPEEFVYIVKDWGSFELVYNQNMVLIYKINYEANEAKGYEIIPTPL